jgi:uncharacterized membrane protein
VSGKTVYRHHNFPILAVLVVILAIVIFSLLIGLIGTAFAKVGFSPTTVAIILIATFLGSAVNIPLFRLKAVVPIVKRSMSASSELYTEFPKWSTAKKRH